MSCELGHLAGYRPRRRVGARDSQLEPHLQPGGGLPRSARDFDAGHGRRDRRARGSNARRGIEGRPGAPGGVRAAVRAALGRLQGRGVGPNHAVYRVLRAPRCDVPRIMSGDHPESVLWLDPGGTTGWAMLDLTKDGTYLFECGQET